MREKGAVFGAEHSGHFFWRDFYNTDSTVLTLLEVMKAYAEARAQGLSFSQMIKPYALYEQTEDVVIAVADKKVALAHIEKKLHKMKPEKITKFDGYFVDFGDVWGAIKPSVTEYAIKLMFESKKKSDASRVQKELFDFVTSIADKNK
jgi:phosphomannomutase